MSLDFNKAIDVGVLVCMASAGPCKQSAPRSRQITTATSCRSIFTSRMLFLMPNRQCQSTEGTGKLYHLLNLNVMLPSVRALKCCSNKHTHTPFNGPFSGTTRVGRYQKGKTSLDFTETRDSEWQWHQSAGPYASLHLAPNR